MKNTIILFMLFIPFSLFAQATQNTDIIKIDNQVLQWMIKISSDSELRIKILEMMLVQTKDNVAERTKLMNTMIANPEMHKMIMATQPNKNETQINSFETSSVNNKNIKIGRVNKTESMLKK
jgi:hypothetical protein